MQKPFKVGDRVRMTEERVRDHGNPENFTGNYKGLNKDIIMPIVRIKGNSVYLRYPSGHQDIGHDPAHLIHVQNKPVIIIKS